jgi:hypothetical protein
MSSDDDEEDEFADHDEFEESDEEFPLEDEDEQADDEFSDLFEETDEFSSENVSNSVKTSDSLGNGKNQGDKDLLSSRNANSGTDSGLRPPSPQEKTSEDKIASFIVGLSDSILRTPSKLRDLGGKGKKVLGAMKVEED